MIYTKPLIIRATFEIWFSSLKGYWTNPGWMKQGNFPWTSWRRVNLSSGRRAKWGGSGPELEECRRSKEDRLNWKWTGGPSLAEYQFYRCNLHSTVEFDSLRPSNFVLHVFGWPPISPIYLERCFPLEFICTTFKALTPFVFANYITLKYIYTS